METFELWQKAHAYFANFNNVSLSLGGLKIDDYNELWSLIMLNCYDTNHNKSSIQIADIGCYTGMATILFSFIASHTEGHVFAIDHFKGSEKSNLEFAGKYFNLKKIYEENISQFAFINNVKTIDMPSLEAVNLFSDNSLDVIFIDADHRYKNIKADIEAWLPKLKKG